MHVYIHGYLYIYMRIHTYMAIYTHTCVHTWLFIHIHVYTYVHGYIFTAGCNCPVWITVQAQLTLYYYLLCTRILQHGSPAHWLAQHEDMYMDRTCNCLCYCSAEKHKFYLVSAWIQRRGVTTCLHSVSPSLHTSRTLLLPYSPATDSTHSSIHHPIPPFFLPNVGPLSHSSPTPICVLTPSHRLVSHTTN